MASICSTGALCWANSSPSHQPSAGRASATKVNSKGNISTNSRRTLSLSIWRAAAEPVSTAEARGKAAAMIEYGRIMALLIRSKGVE